MQLIKKLLRLLLQFAAGFVIFLALLVGIARLFLPEASSLTDDIKVGVRAATGFNIDFRFISAGISFYGPEIRLLDVTLNWADGAEIVAAKKLVVSVDVFESIANRTLVPGRILVRGAEVDGQVSSKGGLLIQGRPWRHLLPPGETTELAELPDLRLQLKNIRFGFRNRQRAGPRINGKIQQFEGYLNDGQIEVFVDIDPGQELGQRLKVEAEVPLQLLLEPESIAADDPWNLFVSAEDFRLDPWLILANLKELPVIGSEGSVKAQAQFHGLQMTAIQTELDLEKVVLVQPSAAPVVIDWVEGEFNWRLVNGGWLAVGEGLQLGRADHVWDKTDYSVRYVKGSKGNAERYIAETNFIRVEDLLPFIRAIAPGVLADAGIKGSIAGDLKNLNAEISLLDGEVGAYDFKTKFTSLGYMSVEQGLELTGYAGELTADQNGGDLSIDTQDGRFGVVSLFRQTFDISKLQGIVVWRAGADGYRVSSNSLDLKTPHGGVNASLELTTGPGFIEPIIDLNATAQFEDVAELPRYLPKILPASVIKWLDVSLVAGKVPLTTLKLTGPLKNFPYVDGTGDFLIKVNVDDGLLDYAPDWPVLNVAGGQIVFDKVSLYSTRNSLTISGINLQQVEVRMDDMRNGILTANGAGQTDLANVLDFMRASPVGETLGPVFNDVYGAGNIDADLDLMLPVKDLSAWQFNVAFSAENMTAGITGIEPEFTSLSGKGTLNNARLTIPAAQATLLGEPVSISVRPAAEGETRFSHLADIKGTMQVPLVWGAFTLPAVDLFGGNVAVDAQAFFPTLGDVDGLPFRIELSSDLLGVTTQVPYPFYKTAGNINPMQAEVRFPEQGIIDVTGSMERGFVWAMQLHDMGKTAGGWTIERGAITRDELPPALPEDPGILVSAYLDSAVLDDWIKAFDFEEPEQDLDYGEFANWQQKFSLIDLQISELAAIEHRFVDVDLRIRPLVSRWDIELTGPWVEGRVLIPFDFLSNETLELDMQRLLLLEPLEGGADDELDPRLLPAVKGRIEEFALGAMQFGVLDLDVQRTENGLKIVTAQTKADSFTTESSSDWEVLGNAQRTRLHMELRSNDFKETLKDLNYLPMVSAERATVITDLLWEGPPGMGMVYESTGRVELTIRDGAVDEVDAGSGRLLGLLSVTALPRRLSLDFSELTNSGLTFNKISGSFRIDFGNAWTCDLGLEGDMADMGMVGRTGILAEDYDQVAAVRPHVSNVAAAGAFLAGPVAGVAALLITQIFKKPLSTIGGSYFTMTGSWDEPLVTPVDRLDLDTARFADCEQELPEMSPEEIQALEELLNQEPKEPVEPATASPIGFQLPPIFPVLGPSEDAPVEISKDAQED
ncbi:MAG: hypothetical protein GY727_16195 [Gammaproteobacteria bacterium]|nr:hypothetical protein [Gammaproteobacteria bacterium]MCP4089181.1 hypothetical protein [Gammaproteobacteria bacterium]MCP4276795.1 hypothetical protein [Gammaproteobacteria bacterium]MCP4830638.1 hypothetical protein [Gammaproteobacteria bacterium]MCP4928447.1 hypothetical protein [Gammaproteobacteria bacterium]